MILLIQYTLIFASVLILVALGGCFSEHSGVVNIGLEGIMVIGALGGALVMKFLPDSTPAFWMIVLVVLASMAAGAIYSLLLAVAAINFNADQTLVGTAMNLLATAAATVFVKAMNTAESVDNVSSTIQYINAKKAFIVNLGGFEFNWFMFLALVALIVSFIVLYKTRFGLRLMACGEHPRRRTAWASTYTGCVTRACSSPDCWAVSAASCSSPPASANGNLSTAWQASASSLWLL